MSSELPGGRSFVTARGWEDLSQTLCSYERLGFAITGALFGEFLQHAEIAASFEAFFQLYSGWREKLALAPILSGRQSGCAPELQELSFDGRLAAVEFLLHAVRRELEDYRQSAALCRQSGELRVCLAAGSRPASRGKGEFLQA